MGVRVQLTCLLLNGDEAELLVDGQHEPARWPAARIAKDLGMPERSIPGRRLVAEMSETLEAGRTFEGFSLAV